MPDNGDRFVRPLFSRFLRGSDGTFPRIRMSPGEYAASVAEHAEELLAARSATPMEAFREADGLAVAGYGLPDFSHLSPESPDDMWLLAETVADALRRFEPRLENVNVALTRTDGVDRGRLSITADLAGVPDRLELTLAVNRLLGK